MVILAKEKGDVRPDGRTSPACRRLLSPRRASGMLPVNHFWRRRNSAKPTIPIAANAIVAGSGTLVSEKSSINADGSGFCVLYMLSAEKRALTTVVPAGAVPAI